MPASFEAKPWSKASEEGGEDGLRGTEVRAAWGKKRPVFVPLWRSRCVKKEIARGNEGCWEGFWGAGRAIGLSPRTLQLAEPWVGGRHAGRGRVLAGVPLCGRGKEITVMGPLPLPPSPSLR